MSLSGNQIRKKFLDYFASKNHSIVKSSSLIPSNDPTLYFTNAGMVPFKNTFTGQESRPYSCATSSQKCMRVSGKHNDLENVGRTARHHTFFEMLGNFSFGDYFKSEACAYAWEFLTQTVKLPKEKLWITVFETDDEAFDIWHNQVGIPNDRIIRLGEKDNFWSMGETGPCGPCSEIIFEQDIPCTLNNHDCSIGTCECDRYLEIWNLVFMQFERHADGKTTPLPKPSIDTGMGLERLTAVIQKKQSNYDCDLFTPLLKAIEKIVKKTYTTDIDNEDSVSMRVLADHIRASVFLISDGVLPSNEGRGYVLRRILRRAIRHGKLLGQTKPFFYQLIPTVVSEMGKAYPDIKANQKTIEKIIKAEEERFFETLEKGLKLLSEEIVLHNKNNESVLSGAVAFKLYDTFGFPLDLTEIIATEQNMSIDIDGFNQCMAKQKEMARAGWKGSGETGVNELYMSLCKKHTTTFVGYESLQSKAKIGALIQDGKEVKSVTKGDFEFICDLTPFYAESGGQAGDKGLVTSGDFEAQITNTEKPVPNLFVHSATIKNGKIKKGDSVHLSVDVNVRGSIMRNHSATHLMHAALRKTLGTHVRQAGSLVNDKELRFDFSHFEAIDSETLQNIESQVNEAILANLPITKDVMSYDDAIDKGALAFFGDKYDDQVRVISIGDQSTELCGGTHLDTTSQIGSFRIISEGSIAAGVRRIEAVTGINSIHLAQDESKILKNIAENLKAVAHELPEKIDKLKSKIKTQDKEIEKLKAKLLSGGSSDLLTNATTINGINVALHETDSPSDARQIATTMRDKIQSGISIVSNKTGNKAIVVVSVTDDLKDKYPANKVLEPIAELLGGRGGGKADIAQAGGPNVAAIDGLKDVIKNIL